MESVLIFRSGVLGDFIISIPAMNLIREENPQARIVLLTIASAHKKDRDAVKVYEKKQKSPWLELLDKEIIDEVIRMEGISWSYLVKELRPVIKNIRADKCYVLTDPLVNFKGNIAKFFLLRFLGVKCKIYGWKDFVITNKLRLRANENNRCINHTLSCLESVFEDPSIKNDLITIKFPIYISDEGERCAEKYWKEFRLTNRKVIVVAPGGVKPHKIWPIDNYISVIDDLLSDGTCSILLTGTEKDIELGKEVQSRINSIHVHNLIGKTDIPCLAAILKRSNLLIGNDGGTMHLGDAVGCVVIAMMPGIELPRSVEPWHNMNNALRTVVPCCPCYNFDICKNGTYKCMEMIEVNDVNQKIKRALNEKKEYNNVKVKVERNRGIPILRICEELR